MSPFRKPRFISSLLLAAGVVTGKAQQKDYTRLAATDTVAPALTDTIAPKQGRLQTAGKVWKNLVLSAPGDFVQMGHIVTADWKQTAAYVGGIALFVIADKPVTTWYQDHIEKNINYKLPKITSSSSMFFAGNDAYLNFAVLGLYGGSFIGNYSTGQRAALNSLKALGYSYIIGQVLLKAAFTRNRPDPTLSDGQPPRPPFTQNPHDFYNFRPVNFKTGPFGTSFPSFHATAYYAVAKVMAMEFHNYWIPYSAVTFLFFADLKSHQHWVGDMVAGGVLGSVIGQAVVMGTRRLEARRKAQQGVAYGRRKPRMSYQVLPSLSGNMAGLSVLVSL